MFFKKSDSDCLIGFFSEVTLPAGHYWTHRSRNVSQSAVSVTCTIPSALVEPPKQSIWLFNIVSLLVFLRQRVSDFFVNHVQRSRDPLLLMSSVTGLVLRWSMNRLYHAHIVVLSLLEAWSVMWFVCKRECQPVADPEITRYPNPMPFKLKWVVW